MIQIGDKIPVVTIPATGGVDFRTSDHKGHPLILYFYPKDNTPGCTKEGQDFRDRINSFERYKALIFGISRDSIASHEKFKAKQKLPFELISDSSEELCKLFGVLKQKSMFGRKYFGIERSTFLFDTNGVLRHEWRKVKVLKHAEEVLQTLKETVN